MENRAGWVAFVALAVLGPLLASCGGGTDGSGSADGPPEKGTVILRDIAFKPGEITVEVGDTVTWRFEDKGIPHDVTAKDDSFKSETMDAGTFRHTFDEPGKYEYLCSLHPAMKGVVEVR